MSNRELQSEPRGGVSSLAHVRAQSDVHVSFSAAHGFTQVARLFERGSFRLRIPRGRSCEAVLINTGGGVTGGDRLDVRFTLGNGANVIATSQAAEKLYRSDGAPAQITMSAELSSASRLSWLPQESILFDGAIVERRLDFNMTSSAQLSAAEILTLGRTAHGESIMNAHWRDRWRIVRDGELVLAENVQLAGAVSEMMERAAIGNGARSVATVVHVAHEAESGIGDARAALAGFDCVSACSAWNGMLVARLAARDTHRLRAGVAAIMTTLTGHAMPRAWSC
jgi:urease accessory protein